MALTPELWSGESRRRLLDCAARGTPVYVYDRARIAEAARNLKAALSPTITRFFYAVKANPHEAVLKVVAAEGLGLECVSAAEVDHVLQVLPGLDRARVLFTPNFAPRTEYEHVLALGGVNVTIDSLYAFEHWGSSLRGHDLLIRVDPGQGEGHHSHVKTAGNATKFGIVPEDIPRAVELAQAAGACIVGLHAHVGSGILSPEPWARTLRFLISVARTVPTVRFIDIGGGYGVVQDPRAQQPLDLAAVRAALDEVGSCGFELWTEPGRYLVAQAGVLLASVTQLKSKEGAHHFVGCDAGMNSLMRPALYGAYHHVVNLSRSAEPHDVETAIVGPICESGDMLSTCASLPRTTAEGDVLLVCTAGAYGHSMANHYNHRAPAYECAI